MQNLQTPNTAKNSIILKWLFLPHFSDKSRFTSSRPDAVLVNLISTKTKKQYTSNGGEILQSGRRQLGETSNWSTSAAAV
jgi:hypothetical protein